MGRGSNRSVTTSLTGSDTESESGVGMARSVCIAPPFDKGKHVTRFTGIREVSSDPGIKEYALIQKNYGDAHHSLALSFPRP